MTYFSFNLKIKLLFPIVEVTKQVLEGFVQNKVQFEKKIVVILILMRWSYHPTVTETASTKMCSAQFLYDNMFFKL